MAGNTLYSKWRRAYNETARRLEQLRSSTAVLEECVIDSDNCTQDDIDDMRRVGAVAKAANDFMTTGKWPSWMRFPARQGGK